MPYLKWLDCHGGADQAIVMIAYVIVSGFLWDATRRNAWYSASALNLQAVATFVQDARDLDGRVTLSGDLTWTA